MAIPDHTKSDEKPSGPGWLISRVIGLIVLVVVALIGFVGMGDVSSGMYGGSMGSLNLFLDLVVFGFVALVVAIVVLVYKFIGRSKKAPAEPKDSQES